MLLKTNNVLYCDQAKVAKCWYNTSMIYRLYISTWHVYIRVHYKQIKFTYFSEYANWD